MFNNISEIFNINWSMVGTIIVGNILTFVMAGVLYLVFVLWQGITDKNN